MMKYSKTRKTKKNARSLTIQETFIEVAAEGSSTEKFIATKVYDVKKDDENGGEGDVGVKRWGNTLRA